MPCTKIDLGDGASAIVCSRGRSTPVCASHGCGRPSEALCDFPLGNGKTCDRKMCARCRHAQPRLGPDRDYCRVHHELALNVAYAWCRFFGWRWSGEDATP